MLMMPICLEFLFRKTEIWHFLKNLWGLFQEEETNKACFGLLIFNAFIFVISNLVMKIGISKCFEKVEIFDVSSLLHILKGRVKGNRTSLNSRFTCLIRGNINWFRKRPNSCCRHSSNLKPIVAEWYQISKGCHQGRSRSIDDHFLMSLIC